MTTAMTTEAVILPLRSALCRVLRALVRESGFTTEVDFARAFTAVVPGLSDDWVLNRLGGRTQIKVAELELLAEAFGVTPAEVLERTHAIGGMERHPGFPLRGEGAQTLSVIHSPGQLGLPGLTDETPRRRRGDPRPPFPRAVTTS